MVFLSGDVLSGLSWKTHTQPFYGSLDFVQDNLGEPVPEETFTHSHLSWSGCPGKDAIKQVFVCVLVISLSVYVNCSVCWKATMMQISISFAFICSQCMTLLSWPTYVVLLRMTYPPMYVLTLISFISYLLSEPAVSTIIGSRGYSCAAL